MEPIGGLVRAPEQVERECAKCHQPFTATVFPGRFASSAPPLCGTCTAANDATEQADRRAQEDAAFARQCAHRLKVLAAPELFEGAKLGDIKPWGSEDNRKRQARALQVAGRIVGDLSSGLRTTPIVALIGGTGQAKTHIMWSVALALAGRYAKHARVIRLADMVKDLREPWRSKSGPSELQRLRAYVDPDFLGIDEVSRHAFYGQNLHQHLYDVLNARLERCRPTMLTSNETMEGLEAILGPALMSRLLLGGKVEMSWTEDFRTLLPEERAAL